MYKKKEKTVPTISARNIAVEGSTEKEDKARVRKNKGRNGSLADTAETSEDLVEWRRLQRKNLNILGLAKKKRMASVPQREQLASTSAAFAKKKRNKATGGVPDRVKSLEKSIVARIVPEPGLSLFNSSEMD